MRKVRIPVYFEATEYARLKKLSKSRGSPMAEILRRALSYYLEMRR